MELATAHHHSAQWRPVVQEPSEEEEVHETQHAPRGLKTLPPATAGAEHFTMSGHEAALGGGMRPVQLQDAPVPQVVERKLANIVEPPSLDVLALHQVEELARNRHEGAWKSDKEIRNLMQICDGNMRVRVRVDSNKQQIMEVVHEQNGRVITISLCRDCHTIFIGRNPKGEGLPARREVPDQETVKRIPQRGLELPESKVFGVLCARSHQTVQKKKT